MKFVTLALLIALSAPALAQDFQISAGGPSPRYESGSFALLFDLGGLASLALESFTSGPDTVSAARAGFGAKYFVADDVALRIGLTVDSRAVSVPVSSDTTDASDELTSLRIGIAPAVTVNLVRTGPVAGYVGGQVEYNILQSSRDIAVGLEPDVEATGSSFGVAALIGAEWFPWNQVSIAGEYRLGFTSSSSEREETRANGTIVRIESPSESAVTLASRGTITVAIYW